MTETRPTPTSKSSSKALAVEIRAFVAVISGDAHRFMRMHGHAITDKTRYAFAIAGILDGMDMFTELANAIEHEEESGVFAGVAESSVPGDLVDGELVTGGVRC
ncbi:MAG: hypothetical protein FWD61_09455 [Phycisphaerales bacterium]|nr:hypothetical protein [Phycisphaerales bacterium]